MLFQRGLLPREENKIMTTYNYQGFDARQPGSLYRTSPHAPNLSPRPHQHHPTQGRSPNPGPSRGDPTPKAARQDLAEVGGGEPDVSMSGGASGGPVSPMEVVDGSSRGDVSMGEQVDPEVLANRIKELEEAKNAKRLAISLVRIALKLLPASKS